MRVGVYALAKDEESNVHDWAASCADADEICVTDTGSTDETVSALLQQGVSVQTGFVKPWRWDDAHNLSLNHLDPTCDVAIRLDLDERLQPNWREYLEKAWTPDINNLRYKYIWSWRKNGDPGLVFYCDRIHAREGFRWSSATHEGLVCWTGEKKQAVSQDLEIHHFRKQGKRHKSDLFLLSVAVREQPHDARCQWYYARELDYMGDGRTIDEYKKYLTKEGGTITETSYALRRLFCLTGDEKFLHEAAEKASNEPEAWERLAFVKYQQKKWKACLAFARSAIACSSEQTHCSDLDAKARALDLASVASWQLNEKPQALEFAVNALAQLPNDQRILSNVSAMKQILER